MTTNRQFYFLWYTNISSPCLLRNCYIKGNQTEKFQTFNIIIFLTTYI
ncbi:hypothetical protein BMQ_pBM50065 (plasmid) [Priestia megaterium QM B1551]|uniref:Uncharacterized protein n=1 Tax=Priestia megaterium (strain ATCC 12872 / QMB1551) TaxID=545693 RepID=D5E3M9_PRIM1|nr:hypothetical protein BMQ_pBM50065 [Priestia megaterium QM B1551]